MIDLGTLGGGSSSSAIAVNESGQVVEAPAHKRQGFVARSPGQPKAGWLTSAPSEVTESYATAVNARGQVVGGSQTANGSNHAFSWTAEEGMVDLGSLGGDGVPAQR